MRRNADRGGPNGRSFIRVRGTDPGSPAIGNGAPVVRLHPVGRPYSVIRTWLVDEQRFHGWYVNLEQPWCRTTVGFESRDDVLDVSARTISTSAACKDADELEFTVAVGMFTPARLGRSAPPRTRQSQTSATVGGRRQGSMEPGSPAPLVGADHAPIGVGRLLKPSVSGRRRPAVVVRALTRVVVRGDEGVEVLRRLVGVGRAAALDRPLDLGDAPRRTTRSSSGCSALDRRGAPAAHCGLDARQRLALAVVVDELLAEPADLRRRSRRAARPWTRSARRRSTSSRGTVVADVSYVVEHAAARATTTAVVPARNGPRARRVTRRPGCGRWRTRRPRRAGRRSRPSACRRATPR